MYFLLIFLSIFSPQLPERSNSSFVFEVMGRGDGDRTFA